MAQAADLITCNQSGTVEAGNLDENSRHMDMDYSVLRYSDKPGEAWLKKNSRFTVDIKRVRNSY